ncbi:penicillin-binding protein 2 [Candidatus Kirkpatrickella diaphorinae]|uniref:Penicillin-binding protein 2 n=1 Tax=Candidatus Kirkpatrickella diaphorinae TaxID=2984322 RepID=A0ABY6GMT5_9PROT|nr:penicillin-binding protein 2 [Candidatus Kirkpatrickella diaphorinae]UYH52208.1 penicillin-binding protein 2 [Candidatus Kirkpatrickella diaphorinae]
MAARREPPYLERMHIRIFWVGVGFTFLFLALCLRLLLASIINPMLPTNGEASAQIPIVPDLTEGDDGRTMPVLQVQRAAITDRNGQILAMSLPVAQVYANPQELIDPADTAKKLKTVLPDLDVKSTVQRLRQDKQFVYLARDISPSQQLAVNNLGIPGIYFENGERRHYPLGRTAAQILGAVDIDDHGVAGIEKSFNDRLLKDRAPIRLSIDTRVQVVTRDVVNEAMHHFQAKGAAGIVMDVRTGEIISMVSLPDYDANDFGRAPDDARFNRAVTGMYEPGSTFKLQVAAAALELKVAHIWDRFSTIPIKIGRFTIRDIKSDHFAPWLALPDVLAKSSNPAAAHIALDIGAERQQSWLGRMGFLDRVPVELPEAARPIVPARKNWGIATVMTIGFGHGIAESPLAIVRGTAATVNGGILITPTLLSHDEDPDTLGADETSQSTSVGLPPARDGDDRAVTPEGRRVLSDGTSRLLRRMLRLDVTQGTARKAEVPGYFVGGKTGTAEKIGANGRYLKHANISAFTSIFPMNNPRYAVYVMLDEPKGIPETYNFSTAGWNATPTAGKLIARIGPILGLFPDVENAAKIDAALAMPLEPAIPPGVRPLGPGNDPGAARVRKAEKKPQATKMKSSYRPGK